MRYAPACGLLLAAIITATPAEASGGWSLADDFSATANPNGAWAYGYVVGDVATAPPSAFRFFDLRLTADGYSFQGLAGTGLPSIGQANQTNPFGVPVGGVILHPGNTASLARYASVARWTAPADGSFRFDGRFIAVDTRGPQVDVAVIADGALLWSGGLSGTGATQGFSLTRTLDAGSSVWFAVANAGIYGDRQWTQLDAQVSAVPEPGTLATLLAGLCAVALVRRRALCF